MLRVALRPRFLGLLALMVVATIVCGLLANWQWDRANRARDTSEQVQAAAPVGLEAVLQDGDVVTNADQGRLITVTGRFDPQREVIVPNRFLDGEDAAVIVTDFEVTDGPLAGTHIPIARGWIPQDSIDGTAPATGGEAGSHVGDGVGGQEQETGGDAVPQPIDPRTLDPAAVDVTPAPEGTVTFVGRLEASEAAADGFVRDGVLAEISTPLLVNEWGGPMAGGYLAVTDEAADHNQRAGAAQPKDLRTLPAARSQFREGLDLQNVSYMLQWVAFGLFFLYIWYRSVRTQYLDERAARREELEAMLGGTEPTTPRQEKDNAGD